MLAEIDQADVWLVVRLVVPTIHAQTLGPNGMVLRAQRLGRDRIGHGAADLVTDEFSQQMVGLITA